MTCNLSKVWHLIRSIGIGVLIVVFAGVLFPLWPPFMRQGVYYLSLLMIGFLGFLMFLGVIRLIIYLVLLLVLGKTGWLFPSKNSRSSFLTESIRFVCRCWSSRIISTSMGLGSGN